MFLGAIYVYLTKLPVLGCASGTRISYLTSLKEVINRIRTKYMYLRKYHALYGSTGYIVHECFFLQFGIYSLTEC